MVCAMLLEDDFSMSLMAAAELWIGCLLISKQYAQNNKICVVICKFLFCFLSYCIQ
jgi:hypothetical protein